MILNNSKILFLDDIRTTGIILSMIPAEIIGEFIDGSEINLVKNYDEFVDYIKKEGIPKFISFDHDLSILHIISDDFPVEEFSISEKTGSDCAKWLVEYCLENDINFPEYYVHSMNIIGKSNIESIINSYKKYRKNERK